MRMTLREPLAGERARGGKALVRPIRHDGAL